MKWPSRSRAARFARLPASRASRRPNRAWPAAASRLVERFALGSQRSAPSFGDRQRRARRRRGEASLPERREHAIGLAAPGAIASGSNSSRPRKSAKLSVSRAAQSALTALLRACDLPGLVAARRVDAPMRRSHRAAPRVLPAPRLDAGTELAAVLRQARGRARRGCHASHQRAAPPTRKRSGRLVVENVERGASARRSSPLAVSAAWSASLRSSRNQTMMGLSANRSTVCLSRRACGKRRFVMLARGRAEAAEYDALDRRPLGRARLRRCERR